MRYLALVALSVTSVAASAQNVYFQGELTPNSPTWDRPREDGHVLDPLGFNTAYSVQPFYVASNGFFTFETGAPAPKAFNTFIAIYRDAFDPEAPLSNFVAADDNFAGHYSVLPGPFQMPVLATGSAGVCPGSQIDSVPLSAGVQYFAINTANSPGNVGEFKSGIEGRALNGSPIDVTLGNLPVPEPTTMAALGLGTLALLRRRRKA